MGAGIVGLHRAVGTVITASLLRRDILSLSLLGLQSRPSQCRYASGAIKRDKVSKLTGTALPGQIQSAESSKKTDDVTDWNSPSANFVTPSKRSQRGGRVPGRLPELAHLPKLQDIGAVALDLKKNVGRGDSEHLTVLQTFHQEGRADLSAPPVFANSGSVSKSAFKLPSYQCDFFGARVFPPSLLAPSTLSPLKKYPSIPPFGLLRFDKNNVTLAFVNSKKHTHQKAAIRGVVIRRLKAAIRLVVERGMRVRQSKVILRGEERVCEELVSDMSEASLNKWMLPDWAYVVYPTLECYRAPFPDMINATRRALITLKENAEKHVVLWSAMEARQECMEISNDLSSFEQWMRSLQADSTRDPYFWMSETLANQSSSDDNEVENEDVFHESESELDQAVETGSEGTRTIEGSQTDTDVSLTAHGPRGSTRPSLDEGAVSLDKAGKIARTVDDFIP